MLRRRRGAHRRRRAAGRSGSAPFVAAGGALLALGVAVVVGAVLLIRSAGPDAPVEAAANSASDAAGASVPASDAGEGRSSPAPDPRSPVPDPTSPEPVVTHPPLTVLNNSTITGLAARTAEQFEEAGWSVREIGNYTGRLPETTAYFEPGQEAAVRALAARFPGVTRVLPRFEELPGEGLTVVLTRYWPDAQGG